MFQGLALLVWLRVKHISINTMPTDQEIIPNWNISQLVLPWYCHFLIFTIISHEAIWEQTTVHSVRILHLLGLAKSSVPFTHCHVQLFGTPLTAGCQAPLSFTISQSLLKLMSVELVMPSNYLILCHPLLLLPSVFPSIRVFSNKSVLGIRWPKYWSFSFSISPSNEHPGLNSFRMD